MKHLGTRPLESDRILLRKITLDDAHDMYHNWASDPEVTRYLTWSAHQSIDDSKAIVERMVASNQNIDAYMWCIQHKADNKVIGTIDLVSVNERNECGVIGYCMSRAYWGQGIMSEALSMIMKYLFEDVGFHRLEATYLVENPASGKVMIKNGMLHEGTQRKKFKGHDGEFHDLALYGIIKDDYFNK